jgi:hypothetical protein
VELRIVARNADVKGFQVLPRRWVVERTFSWLGRCGRLARDYERKPAHAEAMIKVAMIRLMAARLAGEDIEPQGPIETEAARRLNDDLNQKQPPRLPNTFSHRRRRAAGKLGCAAHRTVGRRGVASSEAATRRDVHLAADHSLDEVANVDLGGEVLALVRAAGDEACRGRKPEPRKRPVPARVDGRWLHRSGERCMNEFQRPTSRPLCRDGVGKAHQRAAIPHPRQCPMLQVSDAEVDAEASALGRLPSQARDPACQVARHSRLNEARNTRHENQLGRYLDLEHHLVPSLGMDRADLAQRCIGERPSMPKR